MEIIGRNSEKALMKSLLNSPKSEFLAVYGRRRIGKTYLIKNIYAENIAFEFTGTQNASLNNQLFKFFEKFNAYFPEQIEAEQPKTWSEGFSLLKKCLMKSPEKKVIFFDELPWIAGKRSNFLEELAYWWNDWASEQNLVVVVCGSAASWMLTKVINHKGGLHNRVTKRLNLKPFTLAETKLYLQNLGVNWDNYQITQFYMAVGGVPTYLNEAQAGETVTQTLDRIFFGNDHFMQTEFHSLYAALFEGYQNHINIIRALAEKWQGLSRSEIIKSAKLADGGGLSQILSELEASSFITKLSPMGKKQKDALYRLSDEYSLFYLKFIEKKSKSAKHEWLKIAQTDAYKIWCGYAFENVCIRHVEAIKTALGISGIYTEISSYWHKGDERETGFQIDLLIDRADNAINICEMKFVNDDFRITEPYATQLRRRREAFRNVSKTKKMLFNTLITTYGLKNAESLGQIDHVLTVERLFGLGEF
ncbi:MAG: ATP-binding protein [Arcicella sp.]|nr:ATP-binding protein [Arcicella sp.]